jgi:septal ring factor EnvC (AmiA/AmiB activator)
MKRPQSRLLRPRPSPTHVLVGALFVALLSPAAAQDVSGLEICTTEKQMERRTGCLQANVEFLQQEIRKSAAENRQKLAAAEKDIAAAKTDAAAAHKELAALKDALGKIQSKIDELQKAKDAK